VVGFSAFFLAYRNSPASGVTEVMTMLPFGNSGWRFSVNGVKHRRGFDETQSTTVSSNDNGGGTYVPRVPPIYKREKRNKKSVLIQKFQIEINLPTPPYNSAAAVKKQAVKCGASCGSCSRQLEEQADYKHYSNML
jgi:hypothetical protein